MSYGWTGRTLATDRSNPKFGREPQQSEQLCRCSFRSSSGGIGFAQGQTAETW
jgi:hypothetical protein